MVSGFDLVSQITGLEKDRTSRCHHYRRRADRSANDPRKSSIRCSSACKKYRKPIIAICGSRDQELEGLSDFLPIVLSIHLGPIGLEEAMEHRQTLEKTKILGQTLSRFFTILPK